MSFKVRITPGAMDDLRRHYEFLLDRAQTFEDLALADLARAAVLQGLRQLEQTPFLYRKAGENAFLRELVVPFGRQGFVVLYDIVNAATVEVLAVRHQREDDYH